MDNNIQTSYIPAKDLGNEDKLVYNIFDGELVNKVEIFQNEQTISNAKVIARTSDDRRIELGTLDKGYNMFNMDKPEEVINGLKTASNEIEELLIEGASREEIFVANRTLESAIKAFVDYTEEINSEEKPEIKPEEKTEEGNGGSSNSGEEGTNKKSGKLPQTGDPSALAKMFLGITSLVGGAFVYKKKKRN